MMDINKNTDYISDSSLLFLTFLHQSRCENQELHLELMNLGHELQINPVSTVFSESTVHVKSNSTDLDCDGDLETDGHSINIPLPRDIAPRIELDLPVSAEQARIVREVAAELVRIADDFNDNRFSQAAARLTVRIQNSSNSTQYWQSYLSEAMDQLLNEMPGVHTERMVMALTFSLLKSVCEQAPCLLRGLFNTLVQYTFPPRGNLLSTTWILLIVSVIVFAMCKLFGRTLIDGMYTRTISQINGTEM